MVKIILFQQCSDSVVCSKQLDALEADTFPAKIVHEQQTPEAWLGREVCKHLGVTWSNNDINNI